MLARPHPVLGWLHCQPEDSRRLLDRQLALRDKALEADPSFSGMPASFVEETWVNWLPKAVAKPFYRDQLTAHVAELESQISNLSREIERQSGGLLDQRDAAVDLKQRLKHLLETSLLWSISRFQAQPLPMPNILDGCAEEGPLLTPALSKPKTITKTQVKRCFSDLLFFEKKSPGFMA